MNEKWKTEEFPGFASDIDWEYFNQAPKDQRLNKLSVGDKLTFTHMHPEHDVLTFSIPSIKPSSFFKISFTRVHEGD
ncbi:DUF2169 domain-containing protein [Pelistega indica]|uniref:DUF2169 domain-containing protein n=1 Tax=Pelistega indica TaxID=1414851 RepID=UPI0003F58CE0